MTVAPIPGHVHASTDSDHPHSRLARWAVGLSTVFGVAIVTILIGWAVGGDSFMDHHLWYSGTTTLVGVLAAIAGFVLAIVAKVKHEQWTLLWVPMLAFPVFVALLILGEAFIWE